MGTKIYRESYLPGCQYQSARNTNEIHTNHNWPMFFGNKTIQNGQNCNNILPRTITNFMSGYEKDALKQMMLSHEAAFKHQVSELHRLYKVQKEIMSEIKRKELYKLPIPIETPPSSSSLLHIATYKNALMRWHKSPIPEINSNDSKSLDSRPLKARKRLFDLHLPADNYIDVEEEKTVVEDKNSDNVRISRSRNHKADLGKIQLFDLNEPFLDDDVEDNFLKKSNNGKEKTIYTNSVGHIEPCLDSNFGAKTTFSKLLSDEILKANISRNNKIGNIFRSIDINLVCEADTEVADIENEKKASELGGQIDLNMCASEDEIALEKSVDSKIAIDIDLKNLAADALVAMSSFEENAEDPSEGSLEEALLWLSEAVCKSDFEQGADIYTDKRAQKYTDNVFDEIDEFEAMTLSLIELDEDEYMPSALVLENTELETKTEASHLPNRARRGNSKRLKRDFQREILPGMISLSRHEVAEDVQTFGGIMKAMGSSWPVLGKRRRRLVAEVAPSDEPKVTIKPLMERINSVEIGWGKTPRRPRRRRGGHVGNLSSINSL